MQDSEPGTQTQPSLHLKPTVLWGTVKAFAANDRGVTTIYRRKQVPAKSWYPLAFVAILMVCAGCAQPKHEGSQIAAPTTKVIRFESKDLRVTLVAVIGVEQERSLVRNPGWLEYVLSIENLGSSDLTVQNVKLLNRNGRYVDSASTYQQITVAPDVSTQVAGTVARSAGGSVAGSFIPYGGSIVSVISSAVTASAAEDEADAKRLFALRVLKDVELAPNGRVNGSAFLPEIEGAKSLVIRYRITGEVKTLVMALPAGMR